MWKFIVTWCIVSWVVVPNSPKVDEFGRVSSMVTCELNTKQVIDCDQSREFYTRQEAFIFYNKAKKEEPIRIRIDNQGGEASNISLNILLHGNTPYLANVKIDSVFIDIDIMK